VIRIKQNKNAHASAIKPLLRKLQKCVPVIQARQAVFARKQG
tara:strand:+ start:1798 stop:1923 length:126 start_codon:yes stop_codon:yes gene_type:complete